MDIQNGLLFRYNTSVAIYHCPADTSVVMDADGRPTSRLRNRSYNMSQSVNGYNSFLILPFLPPPDDHLPAWEKLSEIRLPTPSQFFVFIDEHPDTMLDAQFGNPAGMPYYSQNWWDMPADRHNQGSILSFADGHAERWKWRIHKRVIAIGQPPANGEAADYARIQDAMKKWPN